MSRRAWVFIGVAAVALGVAAYTTREQWPFQRAAAQAPERPQQQPRVIPVEVARAERRHVPVRVEALGTVVTVASVALKSRLETEIIEVHFKDGAEVQKGDLLFTLDSRSLQAQIQQAEGTLARDRAQLAGAERDVRRYAELLAKNAGTQLNVDNAKTQADMLRATVQAGEALLQNLRVQLSYTRIHAPITGRISAASVKAGNFVRPADPTPLATINQTRPIYVAFSVPQKLLPEIRVASDEGAPHVEVSIPGDAREVSGRLAMIDNTVDATTGMVTMRALMENADEALWPGTLLNVRLTLRHEPGVVIPSAAVQVGQSGTYVFVVKEGAVQTRPVTVARTINTESVLSSGVEDGEVVVTDGHMLLSNGTKVAPRRSGPSA